VCAQPGRAPVQSDSVSHSTLLLMTFEHARRIKAACPEATLWRIEGYEHVGAYAHPEYRQRLLGFLRTEVFAEET
jgi:hypothetical protein